MPDDAPDQPSQPQPPAAPADPPAPTAPAQATSEKAGGGMRTLGVVLVLVLAFAAAVMFVVGADISDTRTCDEARENPSATLFLEECFDGSSAQKSISVPLAFASGAVGALAALLALAFVVTGRRGQLALRVAAAAIALGALSIGIGSI